MLGDALLIALRQAVAAFEETGLDYALVGGLGALLRGRLRNTRDCDVLAMMPDDQLSLLRERLRAQGFSHLDRADRHRLDDVVLYLFWHAVGDSGFSLSLDLQIGSSSFHKEVLARAEPVEFLGTRVQVATREDLILLKLTAWRPIDRADAIDLLQSPGRELDDAYLDRWSAALNVTERLAEVRAL